jgi:hypothetical protein
VDLAFRSQLERLNPQLNWPRLQLRDLCILPLRKNVVAENELARWRNNVDLWQTMVDHMEQMQKNMESMQPGTKPE